MFEPESEDLSDPLVSQVVASNPAVEETLDSRVVTYWVLSGLVSWLVLAMIVGAAGYAFLEDPTGEGLPLLVAVATALGLMLLWGVVSPALAYRRWRFSVDDELMLTRFGIFFHAEKAIPISRLQHIDLTRGPLERMFGLATLVVFTAGTEAASFRLPGLAIARAEELRDQILLARGDDVI